MAKQGIKFHGFVKETEEELTANLSLRGKKPVELWIDEVQEEGETRFYFRCIHKNGSEMFSYFTLNDEGEATFPSYNKYYIEKFDPEGIYENVLADA